MKDNTRPVLNSLIFVLYVVALYGLVGEYQHCEEHTACIFRSEVG
jgi:hypothetical protein